MDKKQIGLLSLLFSAFLYGFYGILTRIVAFNIPLFFGSFFRNSLSSLILLSIILLTRKWKPIHHNDVINILVRSGLGFVGFLGAFIPLIYLPIGTFYFINYAGVVIGAYIVGLLFMKEQITKIKMISLIISLFGLSLIYSFSLQSYQIPYTILAFLGGIGTACWNIFTKKTSHTYSALQLNFIDFVLFSVIGLFFSIVFKEQWVMPQFSFPWLANYGFILMFLITGQLIIIGFKYIDSQKGSLILLCEIVFGIMFAYLFFKESTSLFAILGGLCIIFSIVFPYMMHEKN